MKKRLAFAGIFALLVSLITLAVPTEAAPTDCDTTATGEIVNQTSLNIDFSCAVGGTAYFGVCDSGTVLDDFFNIVYNGNIVATNEISGNSETVTIGSATVTAGPHMATLNSLTGAAVATYSYAISTELAVVEGYLQTNCGADFSGPTTSGGSCHPDVAVFTADMAPGAGRWAEMPGLLGDEMLDAFAISGKWRELPAIVKARYGDGLLDRINYYLPFVPGQEDEGWRATIAGFRRK